MGFGARRRGIRKSEQGSGREATGKRTASQNGGPREVSSALVDGILEAAGARPDSRQLMRAALEQLMDYTGCEAAAIRLEEMGDYPYVVALGFPAKYLATDNSLLSRSPDRKPVYDDEGRPVLECACGDIIRGRAPADHPRFTTQGTFWTASTSDEANYDDRGKSLSSLRGHCAAGGYESVACIPLRARDEIYGLLQLNSKHKHRISPEVLSVLEPAVAAFATHLQERLVDEADRSGEALHEALSAAMVEAFAYCRLYFDESGSPEDWAFVTVNEAFRKLFSIDDPVAKRNSQVMPGWQKALPDVVELFGRVARTRKPERLERYLPKLGRWLVMRVSSPAPDHFLAVFEDVSERKAAEERLLRTQFSLDNIGDYPLWVDAQGQIVDVSESTCRHLEYSRDELLSMTMFDIDPELSSDEWRARWRESSESGPKIVERRHRTKNGRVFPAEVSTSHVCFGSEEYDCQFCRDISKRRQVEERLKRAQYSLDNVTDYPLWVDAEGRIFEVSESTCRHLEYSRDELLSMTIFDINPELDPDEWRTRWLATKNEGTRIVETRHRTKSGRVFPVESVVDHVSFGGQGYSCGFCRDISDRKEMEEKLQRTQFTIDSMDDYLMWGDLDGNILDVSESTCRHLEYSRDELLSMTAFDIDPDLTPERWANHVRKMREQQTHTVEIRHRAKSGRVFPVEDVVTLMVFGGKEYDCSFCRDISERKQTEEKLRRTQFTVDHMSDYPMWTDSQGRIVEVGDTTCRRLGYSREELLSMTVFDIDIETSRDDFAAHLKAIRESGSITMEIRHRTKSGRVYPVEVAVVYVAFDGQEFTCGFCRDISERRQAEEKLRRTQFTVDHMSDYLLWLDVEARIVEVSESTCRYLGYSREELLSMTLFDIDPRITRERWSAHWEAIRDSGTRTIEVEHRSKDGKLRPVEIATTHVSFAGQEYDCSFCRDISERKQMEESLRLNRLTVEQALDMVFWIGRNGSLVYANESACRLSGRSLEEMTGLYIWEVDPSISADSWEKIWQRTKEYGPFQQEGLLRSADGHTRPVEVASYHVDFEGNEYGVAFARDITERKRAEQELRDSEERYRQLFEVESDAIILTDAGSGRILDVNPATSELFGYKRDELLTLSSTDLSVEPELRRDYPGELAAGAVLRWNRKKDGTVFPAEVRFRYFELEGREVRVAAIRDVTERLKAEEELLESRQMLQLVLDTVPLRIVWKDRDLRYLGCNKAMALDLRLQDPSTIFGLTDDDLLPEMRNVIPPSAHSDDLEVIRTGVAKLHYEETMGPSETNPRILRTSKVPLRDLSGDIIGLLAVHEDVTERTMTLRALREREEQLRHSQKLEAVGRLAGGIAHDFNNVLTTIIGYSDLVLGSPEGSVGPVAEDVREIKAAAERASALTKQILAFSRRQSLRPEVLSLNRLVSDIQRMLARTIGADIELVTALDPALGLVDVDEHQFVQIMLNLAVNARDAMPEGGTVTVTTANVELDEAFCQTHPDAQPGSYVMVSVADTGTGMDEKTLAHVFEPFFTTKATGEGTGLGLATVYGVVAQSGGCTCVESEIGRGTTFTIYLPRLTSDFDGRAESILPAGLSTLDTVLVVDDDDAFRALTIRILEKRGYRAIPASDGDQAVEILQNRDIFVDLLLVDIVMPGSLQGDQVGQIAGKLRPGLPIIYMSSYSRDTILNIGPASVASDYLEKPFTADALVQKIRASLGRDQADVSKT